MILKARMTRFNTALVYVNTNFIREIRVIRA